jgi:hypothetical protein
MWLTAGIFLLLIESFSPFGTVLTGLMGQAICVRKETACSFGWWVMAGAGLF